MDTQGIGGREPGALEREGAWGPWGRRSLDPPEGQAAWGPGGTRDRELANHMNDSCTFLSGPGLRVEEQTTNIMRLPRFFLFHELHKVSLLSCVMLVTWTSSLLLPLVKEVDFSLTSEAKEPASTQRMPVSPPPRVTALRTSIWPSRHRVHATRPRRCVGIERTTHPG